MKLLAIDTSNMPLVVAAAQDQQLMAQVNDYNQKTHSSKLLPAIQKVTQQAGWQPQDIDRFVVAQGPGSFTGIRIAVTTAKMLAWTLEKELVAISSLAALACNVHNFKGLIVPFFDARHQNVFTGVYRLNAQAQLIRVLPDQHIAMAQLLKYLQQQPDPVCFLGTGMANYQVMIETALNAKARILPDQAPQAASLINLGLQEKPLDNLNAFNPNYLRQTQAEMVWHQAHPELQPINYVEDV